MFWFCGDRRIRKRQAREMFLTFCLFCLKISVLVEKFFSIELLEQSKNNINHRYVNASNVVIHSFIMEHPFQNKVKKLYFRNWFSKFNIQNKYNIKMRGLIIEKYYNIFKHIRHTLISVKITDKYWCNKSNFHIDFT